MGLRALFGMDPAADVAKGEKLLELDPVRALELAERAGRSDHPDVRGRALDLAARARARVLAGVLARADEAEAKGELEHAASWLESALRHESDDGRRAALAARREQLLERAEEERNPFAGEGGRRGLLADDGDDEAPRAPRRGGAEPPEGDDDTGDLDGRYETLVAMLDEAVAPLYDERPPDFRAAVVALNDGDAAAALPPLDALVAADPDDPVLRLERGRARLLLGDAAGARADLEAARPAFGDDPIDATDALSLPLLEGEAAFAAGEAAGVVARLAALADPAGGRVEICQLYAAALVEAGDDAALPYLERAASLFPRDPRFRLHLAHALERRGDVDGAIAALAPSAAPAGGGRGGRQARHLPSLRALAGLHLRRGTDLDRAAELMAMVAHEQDGLLGAEDHATLARYYHLAGDEESAAWCEAESRKLAAAGAHELSAPPGGLTAGRQRLL